MGDLVKEYDFRTLRTLDDFTTRYIWERDEIINDESQYYVDPDAVHDDLNPFRLTDAGLSIIARPTPPELLGSVVGQPFISGLLTTRHTGHSQWGGLWEISAKLPNARGAWPAFWLLPTFDRWPEGVPVLSEIDVMEAVADVLQGVYHGTVHTRESGALVASKDNAIATGVNLVDDFHRYGLKWTREELVWLFDGQPVKRRPTPADMLEEPRHALLNFAVGGWGGDPDPADYPASFDIEWLRIYAPDDEPGIEEPPEDKSKRGDVIYTLDDGRQVTRADVNLVTEWMIQSTRSK